MTVRFDIDTTTTAPAADITMPNLLSNVLYNVCLYDKTNLTAYLVVLIEQLTKKTKKIASYSS